MNTITLNNGIEMPLVGLGTWDLRDKTCVETVCSAIQLGYRLIDTAQMYENEKEVGEGIKKSGIDRDQLFVTTKLDSRSNSYQKAKRNIEKSLSNLQLSYIDLLLIHEPYSNGKDMYRALEEALQEGKVRAVGISNYNERLYREFIKYCHITPCINQLECHVFYQKWNYQEEMKQDGVSMQAWAPLSQGMGNITNNKTLIEIGKKYNKSACQIALRFLVQRGIPVIPKSSHKNRLIENLNIFDFTLCEEDMNQIKLLDCNDTFFPWTNCF